MKKLFAILMFGFIVNAHAFNMDGFCKGPNDHGCWASISQSSVKTMHKHYNEIMRSDKVSQEKKFEIQANQKDFERRVDQGCTNNRCVAHSCWQRTNDLITLQGKLGMLTSKK